MDGSKLWPTTEAEKTATRTEAYAVRASFQRKHYMVRSNGSFSRGWGASYSLCGAELFKTREEAEEEARKWCGDPGFMMDPKSLSTIRVYVDLTSEIPVPEPKKRRA
jgi:hypothetical protein